MPKKFGRMVETDALDKLVNQIAAEVERLSNITVTAPLDISDGSEGINVRIGGLAAANLYVEAITAVRRDQTDCRGYIIEINVDTGEKIVSDEEVEFIDIGVFPTFIEIPTGSGFETFLKSIGGVYVIDPPHWIHSVAGHVNTAIHPMDSGQVVTDLGTIDEVWNWTAGTVAEAGSRAMCYWGTYPGASFPEPHWHIVWECESFASGASL